MIKKAVQISRVVNTSPWSKSPYYGLRVKCRPTRRSFGDCSPPNELSESSAVHGYRWRVQLCNEFHLVQAGVSCMLGENVVASCERARRSPYEMTSRRRGVILKAEVYRLATTFMFRELCGSDLFDRFGPQP